jgi:hypothetical protein
VISYGVVIAFQLAPTADRQPDSLRDELAVVIESMYDVEGPVSVAVREVTPGTGKVTSGQWGAHGI